MKCLEVVSQDKQTCCLSAKTDYSDDFMTTQTALAVLTANIHYKPKQTVSRM